MNRTKHLILFIISLVITIPAISAPQTKVTIEGEQFYINGKPTYQGRVWKGSSIEGLLMNSRMVNGIFDDLNPETRETFKYPDTGVWDADRNTDEFIVAMEEWYSYGLLSFTLNLQGGSPIGYGNNGWINSAFDPDGGLRDDYKVRLKRVLDKADQLGMVVMLGYFYFGADDYLVDEEAIINATKEATEWILDEGYENILVEVANESDGHYHHEILKRDGIWKLIEIVKSIEKDGRRLLVSTSFSGHRFPTDEVCDLSDYILLHGNGVSEPATMRRFIRQTRAKFAGAATKPIVINEDDHYNYDAKESNFSVAVEEYASWGFFDYRRKGEGFDEGYQSIPANWGISSERKREFFDMVKEITNFGGAPDTFENPILSGYYPDPSICRVGEDYYMVNSSFAWWPAMPIHKSKDLINWELVGYGATDTDKLLIGSEIQDHQGIYAVTIRHHDGLFYLITTMVGGKGNFYITASDPAGPWSDPVWLETPGIDPSLFWDDDGKCYYVGHNFKASGVHWKSKNEIWLQELDLKSGKMVGERVILTNGHAANATCSEGPHIYKIDGKYILMIAEGGTGYYHAVTQFQSDDLTGPYIPNKINPILTHRHLGFDYPIVTVGHADIVETQNGDWWMVALGTRNFEGNTYLARETFLTPIELEKQDETINIVVNRGHGKILQREQRPNLPWSPVAEEPVRDEFNGEQLSLQWNMLRSPEQKWHELKDGVLSLDLRAETLSQQSNPSLLTQRIRGIDFEVSTQLKLTSKKDNEAAGVALYRDKNSYITFMLQGNELILSYRDGDDQREVARVEAPATELILSVCSDKGTLSFKYGTTDSNMVWLDETLSLMIVGTKREAQFHGPMIGVYATSDGKKSKTKAKFDWFEYKD